MFPTDIIQITVYEVTVASDGGLIIGPSFLAPFGYQEKLEVLFKRAHEQLCVKVPFEKVEWLQFPFGDPVPGTNGHGGSGAVHVPATLHGDQTPESLRWQDGVRIYFKDATIKVDYTKDPRPKEDDP